jgi:phosphatidylserine decarboxylase
LRPFARGGEGTILLFTALLAATAWMRRKLPQPVGDLLLLLALPLWALVLFFFRDPERAIPDDDGLILSPADGRIVAIQPVHEPLFIQGPAVRLSTFMSLWDVHVNRSPVSGEVKLLRHVPGKFLEAFRPEASDVNEHILLGLQSGERRVLVKQIAGILARRCVNRAIIGEHLERGQRFGLIRFSSRVDLFLPPEVQLLVQVGDGVKGGSSVVARWPAAQEETA